MNYRKWPYQITGFAYLTVFVFILFSTLPATGWVPVGNTSFSAGTAEYESLYVYNGTPYIAYGDDANGGKTTVMMFDGSNWAPVGSPGFSAGLINNVSLYVYNGTPYVAYMDVANGSKATVMKYDGSNWVSVGSPGFSAGKAEYESLYVYNGTPYVAYDDGANGSKVTVMKYDGSNWVSVGSPGFSAGITVYFSSNVSLYVYNGTPYVAYSDGDNGSKATVMTYDGSNWVNVGSPDFSAGGAYFESLNVYNGTPYIAFMDYANGRKTTVMMYDGSNWVNVGSPGFSLGNSGYIPMAESESLFVYNGVPYVAEDNEDAVYEGAIVYKYDGSNWVTMGNLASSTGDVESTSLFIDQGTVYVGFQDRTSYSSVWKYELETPTQTPSSTPTSTMTATQTPAITLTFTPTSTNTSTPTATAVPFCFEFKGAFPNPAATYTYFIYNVCRDSGVDAVIYTVSGEVVRNLHQNAAAGWNHLYWDTKNNSGKGSASGVFIYSIEVTSDDQKRKIWGKVAVIK
jgi:hypothetical protein